MEEHLSPLPYGAQQDAGGAVQQSFEQRLLQSQAAASALVDGAPAAAAPSAGTPSAVSTPASQSPAPYLTPAGYLPRLADAQLAWLISLFPAVEVTGPMWCGKTWTSLCRARSATKLANPRTRDLVAADLSVGIVGERPHLIDEWQDVPELWDYVRYYVDEQALSPASAATLAGATPTQREASFILTGSSSPSKDRVSHSGAGRIARMSMYPLTLHETGMAQLAGLPRVSLAAMFKEALAAQAAPAQAAAAQEASAQDAPPTPLAACLPQPASASLQLYLPALIQGGWPQNVGATPAAAQSYLTNYLDAIFQVTLAKAGIEPRFALNAARALARNVGTAAKYSTLAQDVYGVEAPTKQQQVDVRAAVEALANVYLLTTVPGWDAPVRSKARLRTSPKRYFADPSLPAALLGITQDILLQDAQLMGLLFESLVMRDLTVFSQLLPVTSGGALPAAGPLSYYRDSRGLEVDAIIELNNGAWAAFEVKLGAPGVPAAVDALTRLRKKVQENPAARNPQPAFMAVLVGAGDYIQYLKEENIYVIPFACLAP